MPKHKLAENLKQEGALKTPAIISAFKNIDRADFVLPEYRREACEDCPLPIGFGQTISQPYTVAFMLELLQPKIGDVILDVGSGSGWQAALLAHIVGPGGRVVTVERIRELAAMAAVNIDKYQFVKKGIVEAVWGDATKILEGVMFDKIVAAAAGDSIPRVWKDALKPGGRIVAPVNAGIVAVDKKSDGSFQQREYPGFAFVPLVSG